MRSRYFDSKMLAYSTTDLRSRYRLGMRFILLAFFLLTGSAVALPSTVWAQAEPETASRKFAEAFQLYTDQLYEQAIHRFQAFRTEHPDHLNTAEALYYQAEGALTLGRQDEAVRLFELFRQEYPSHPLAMQASLALGKYFYEAEEYDRAIEMLTDLLHERPSAEISAKALYVMAESALAAGRIDEAMGYYRRAAEEYPSASTAPTALFALAYTQVQEQRLDEAAQTLETLSTRYPESPYVRDVGLVLAEVYFELGDFQRVIEEVQRRQASIEGETLERAEFLLAESYNKLRDAENAEAYYRRFTDDRPASAYYRLAQYGLGWNLYQEEDYAEAAGHFARVRMGYDDELTEQATYYQAVNLRLAGNTAEAAKLWKEYLNRWPSGKMAVYAHYELGLAQYDLAQWEEANKTLDQYIRRYESTDVTGEALYLLGNTYLALGKTNDAQRYFDRALAVQGIPEALQQEVAFQKAMAYYRNEQYTRAATDFTKLYESQRGSDLAGDALFYAAESNYQANNLDVATRLFRTYLRDYGDEPHADAAQYALAWSYFKAGDYANAAANFERFLNQYQTRDAEIPYRTDAILRLADSYYAMKRYSDAVRAYARASEESDRKDYVLYQTAQAQANAGNTTQAIAAYRKLRSEHPRSDWSTAAQYQIGALHFQLQQYDQAIAEFQRLIQEAPNDPLAARAQYSIGDALYNAGRLDEAVDAYRAVLDRYPRSPYAAEAVSSIQFALMSAGQERQATRILEEYQKSNPNSPVADQIRFRQIEAKYQSGQTDAAVREFKEFISTSRNVDLLPHAYYYLADILIGQGQTNEAEAYLRRVLRDYSESPRYPEAALLMGDLYSKLQHYADAIEYYQLAESRGNERTAARARLGQSKALLSLGQVRQAEELLQRAVQNDPNSADAAPALLGLAQVYERQNNTTQAANLYRQVVNQSQDETGAEALYSLGLLLLNQGDAQGAVEELSRMPTLYPDFPDWLAKGYLAQGRAFQALDRKGDAQRMYDLVLSQFANTEYATTAKREKAAL